jgi:hypothetical protein
MEIYYLFILIVVTVGMIGMKVYWNHRHHQIQPSNNQAIAEEMEYENQIEEERKQNEIIEIIKVRANKSNRKKKKNKTSNAVVPFRSLSDN